MASPQERDLETLIARIAASRGAVAHDIAHLRRRLDVPSRIKESVLSKPLAWLGGSLGAGFVTSLLLKRRRPPKTEAVVKKSLWAVLLGGAFTLARPALQSWASREFQNRFAQSRYSQDKHS
jgi:hypothetical protein